MPHKMDEAKSVPTQKVSWFEFLLKEELMEEHLAKANPDPSASDLISVFLHQAEVALNTARDMAQNEQTMNAEKMGDKDQILDIKAQALPADSKKAHALRLLAIKVVAFLKWNLDILEKSVPLPVSYEVMKELVTITTPTSNAMIPHAQLDLTSVPDEMFFALQLHYRWWVRSVVKESFCTRPSKVVNVQVPGLLDAPVSITTTKETVMKMLHEGLDEALTMLERLLAASRTLTMPCSQSFGMLNENTNAVQHNWSNGVPISADELSCQMSYDLACVLFLRGNVDMAAKLFQDTKQLLTTIGPSDFCRVNDQRLKGYCAACGLSEGSKNVKLFTRIEATRKQQFEGVVGLLQEDNQTQEVNLQYRQTLEEEMKPLKLPGSMLFRVLACNVVRRLQEGQTASVEFRQELSSAPPDPVLFFFKVCEDAMKTGSFSQKAGVKNFLRHLCQVMPENKLVQEQLSQYFSMEEWEELGRLHSQSQHKWLSTKAAYESSDPDVKQGELEKKLLSSYDPAEIKSLIGQFSERIDRNRISSLSDKWRLPPDMSMNLSNVKEPDRTYAHILIAKAKVCSDLKLYAKVRELLNKADPVVKEASYSLSRLVRWEVLLVDLLQVQWQGTLPLGQSHKELAKKAKTCITSLQLDQDLRPRAEVVANCASFLFSTKDWDYLTSIDTGNSGTLQITRLLATLCKELPLIKNARKAARELWESVVLIFTNSQQQKRTSSGAVGVVQRHIGMGVMAQQDFIQYICVLQDPVAVSTMISCLTKLYNLLKDDISSEISSDYILLWPTTLGSSSLINVAAVSEAVKSLMTHALRVSPSNPSWLRTQADIHFGLNQYAQALKLYLEAGAVASEIFSEPVPKVIYDDNVYRRMIKCCSYLQCHMQVAVLCQFLDDIDYATVFKALQERTSHDAMDGYYDFIWDITILEYIINLHSRRGEHEKKQAALREIGQLELNSSNPPEILMEASKLRKTRFLRALLKQYS